MRVVLVGGLLVWAVLLVSALPEGFDECTPDPSKPWKLCLPASFPTKTYTIAPDDKQRDGETHKLSEVRGLCQVTGNGGGVLFWLEEGDYYLDDIADETSSNYHNLYLAYEAHELPIVLRAKPGHRVRLHVSIRMYGGGYWLWGLEIFDPTGNAKTSAHGAISIYGAQSRIINCYIHGNKDRSGIIAGDQVPKYSSEWGLAQIEAGSPHKVIYGNILMHNGWNSDGKVHNIYAINEYSTWRHHHLVDNVLLRQRAVCEDCNAIWGWSDGGTDNNNGFYLHGNVIHQGRLTFGEGQSQPNDHIVIEDSHIVDTDMILYDKKRTVQIRAFRNHIVDTRVEDCEHWGAGASVFTVTEPNEWINNTFIAHATLPFTYVLRTSIMPSGANVENWDARRTGQPLRTSDRYEGNKYTTPLRLGLKANLAGGPDDGYVKCPDHDDGWEFFDNLADWRSATKAAGAELDVTSTLIEPPTSGVEVHITPNVYERRRANVVVYNWAGTKNTAKIDPALAGVKLGEAFSVYAATCFHCTPLFTTSSWDGTDVSIAVTARHAVLVVVPPFNGESSAAPSNVFEVPTVNSISPTSGHIAGGHIVTITGDSFVKSDLLLCTFGSAITPATFVSATQVRCVVPKVSGKNEADQPRHGIVTVAVSNDGGVSFSTTEVDFTYDADAAPAKLPWEYNRTPEVQEKAEETAQNAAEALGASLALVSATLVVFFV